MISTLSSSMDLDGKLRALVVLIFFLVLLPSVRHVDSSDGEKTDFEALLMFKKAVEKDKKGILHGWVPNKGQCNWYGVSCTSQRVTKLDLSQAELSGSLPLTTLASMDSLLVLNLSFNSFFLNASSLVQLPPSLQYLDLSFNGIFGSVPEGLFLNNPNLISLQLPHNNLSGSLPENLLAKGISDNLQFLDLSYNNISGPIWSENSCNALLYLDLSKNTLSGEIPSSLSDCYNLNTLNLSFNGLSGGIPVSFKGFTKLQSLDLSQNHLNGIIPQELANSCETLQQLRLSSNNISGSFPLSFSPCSSLKLLDLSNNNISGPFDDSIAGNLQALETLLMSNNFVSGEIPASISNCKNLKVMDFSSNKLSGHIPENLCPGLALLEELRLPDNLLSGGIPPSLAQCPNLKTIDLSINYLNGTIPPEFGGLKNLEHFMAWFNGLSGPLPKELGHCSNLKTLILNNNLLSGQMPPEIFNSSNLEWISLTSNGISGQISPEFGQLKRLAILQLANNSFSGVIPKELGNCSSLVWLDLNSNQLSGVIPAYLGRKPNEKPLSGILSGNTLAFVRNVGNSCKGVGGLLEFAGIRPERLLQVPTLKTCDFTRLYSGAALNDWTHYQSLEYLDLSYNNLNGSIPEEFGSMIVLQVLGLSHNKITGEIPSSLGNLRYLGVFDASHNHLQGRIPESFSNLTFLVQIDLSDNALTGPIPSRGQLSTLPASQYRDNPGLCGVPLAPCQSDNPSLNGSGNYSAEVPVKPRPATWANSMVLGILVSMATTCVLIVWAVTVRGRRRAAAAAKAAMINSLQASYATTWKIGKEKEPLSINVATFQRPLRKLTFSQLIEATNGFCAGSLIGSGGFGEVFKATLKDGSSVAIKKLIRLSCQGDREFMAEMETLGKIKHRNLVPLLGYCKIGEERLLVYEYMEFGSLEEMLHGDRNKLFGDKASTSGEKKEIPGNEKMGFHGDKKENSGNEKMGFHGENKENAGNEKMAFYNDKKEKPLMAFSSEKTGFSIEKPTVTGGFLSWELRKKIAKGAAKGLAFLHHNCIPHIIHRDMKSSNVLLDSFMEARVSDFGMARLISCLDTHLSVSTLAGTPGYVPPEYYQSFRCTAKGDVYSFGVVMLEILTGKRPTDKEEFGETNLVGWVKAHVRQGRGMEVIDVNLKGNYGENEVEKMRRYLDISMRCVEDLPSRRPNMLEVVSLLREIEGVPQVGEEEEKGDSRV
ncbi:hypothetical protein AMTRI_Chr04g181340 [Amborella trichopoda]